MPIDLSLMDPMMSLPDLQLAVLRTAAGVGLVTGSVFAVITVVLVGRLVRDEWRGSQKEPRRLC